MAAFLLQSHWFSSCKLGLKCWDSRNELCVLVLILVKLCLFPDFFWKMCAKMLKSAKKCKKVQKKFAKVLLENYYHLHFDRINHINSKRQHDDHEQIHIRQTWLTPSLFGAPGGDWTHDQRLQRPLLCLSELRAHQETESGAGGTWTPIKRVRTGCSIHLSYDPRLP